MTKREHDTRLYAVLRRLEEAEVTLDPVKCVFSRRNVKFLGQLIDKDDIRPDSEKVTRHCQNISPNKYL